MEYFHLRPHRAILGHPPLWSAFSAIRQVAFPGSTFVYKVTHHHHDGDDKAKSVSSSFLASRKLHPMGFGCRRTAEQMTLLARRERLSLKQFIIKNSACWY